LEECKLDFVEPIRNSEGKPVAQIPKSEILANVNKWRNTLAGYVLGDKPFYMHLKTCRQTMEAYMFP